MGTSDEEEVVGSDGHRQATTDVSNPGSLRRLYAGPFVSYLDRFSIPPLLIPIARDLGVSLAAATLAATLYFLLYGAMQPVYGLLSDRLGRVRVLRLALLGMSAAGIASALAPNLAGLVVARAVTGACAAGILPTSLVYVGDVATFGRRQKMVANIVAASAVGTTLATVEAGLVAHWATWRIAFVIPAAGALGLAIFLGTLPESLAAARGAGPMFQLRRVLARPWAVFLFFLAMVEGAVVLGFLTFLAPALEAHGVSPAIAGLAFAAYGVATFVGAQAVKRLVRLTSAPPAALIAGGGALLLIAYVAAALDQRMAGIAVASLLSGVGFAFMHSTLQTWATDVCPEARGTATAFFSGGVFTGAAIATAAVGGLASTHQYQLLFLVACAVTIPVLVVSALARARYRSQPDLSGAK